MKKKSNRLFKTKYVIEFLSMFIAVLSAFALNNWNENRRDQIVEEKILLEIKNGLKLDLEDFESNVKFHERNIKSIIYLGKFLKNDTVQQDSSYQKYTLLFRETVLLLNRSGYESLKNKGLEIIENDSLRFNIIRLYENVYKSLYTLEQEIPELQTYHYSKTINNIFYKYYTYDTIGNFKRINKNNKPTKVEINFFKNDLRDMYYNEVNIDSLYSITTKEVNELLKEIDNELKVD